MPDLASTGRIVTFPHGLPGFEDQRDFIRRDDPAFAPLVVLESRTNSALQFVAAPITSIDRNYELTVSARDLEIIGVSYADLQQDSSLVDCLAIVCIPEQGSPTANLVSPLVINRATGIGVQAVSDQTRYRIDQPLRPQEQSICS